MIKQLLQTVRSWLRACATKKPLHENQVIQKIMTLVPPPEDADYYQLSSRWYADIYEAAAQSRNVYRVFSFTLLGLLALCILTVVVMMPLKTVSEHLLIENKTTGELTEVQPLSASFKANWALDRYFIIQYVINRESFDVNDVLRPYYIVNAMSAASVMQAYDQSMSETNHQSPINVLGKSAYRKTHIIYVNRLSPDTAEVRFSTTTHDVAKDSTKTLQWHAIVKWTYRQLNADENFTAKNPLGFTVTDYDKSEAMTS